MDGAAVADAVRDECATELDRLGSEKSLVASTAARLDRESVLAAAADAEARARETFETWGDDEPNPAAAEAFAAVAETERDHYERVVELLDDPHDDPDADAIHEYLRELDGTPERVGAGLVGRPLVASRSLLQVINFFVNEGASAEAELFRELRAETDDTVEEGTALLDEVCESEEAYERAREAAIAVVGAAYEEYAGDLDALGIDPKPVC